MKVPSGFTLVELMVTVAVLAIVLAIGVPSFQNAIAGNQVTSAANDFLATINMARAEAIRRGARVTVCKGGAAATQCDANAASDWKDGWIVFVDPAPQSPPQIENPQDIVARGGGTYAVALRILGETDPARPTALYVSFTPDGAARLMDRSFLSGLWHVCSTQHSSDNERARAIEIGASGHAVVRKIVGGLPAACPAP